MKDNDDILIKSFFDANRQHIDDNGFTRGVMHALPPRCIIYNRIWTVLCFIVFMVCFYLLNGWEQMKSFVESSYRLLGIYTLLQPNLIILYFVLMSMIIISLYNRLVTE